MNEYTIFRINDIITTCIILLQRVVISLDVYSYDKLLQITSVDSFILLFICDLDVI